MIGNFHVRFLGEGVAVTPLFYPAIEDVYDPEDIRDEMGCEGFSEIKQATNNESIEALDDLSSWFRASRKTSQ